MTRRIRRTAEDARVAILAAAEARLAEAGPAGLRLQDLARDVGVSHPAILHHFGSREGLVEAVVEQAARRLQDDLIAALAGAARAGTAPAGASLFDRVFATLADRGHARVLGWLVLGGERPLGSDALRKGFERIVELTHAARLAALAPGAAPPSREDTQFTIVLSALALFGQALAGPATFAMAGLGHGGKVGARFREWLAALLSDHLVGAAKR